MPIRTRLILTLGALLLLTVAATVLALLFDARHRVRSEVTSSIRMTEMLLRSSLASLEGAPNHAERLASVVFGLQRLRHVRVQLDSQRKSADRPAATKPEPSRSEYLAELFSVDPGPAVRVAVFNGREFADTIILEPHLADEMDEVLETIGRVAIYALIAAAGGVVVTTLLVAWSLAPIHTLDAAMHSMEEGDYDIVVPQRGPPEISRICVQFNHLAAALRKSRQDNQQLSIDMVKLQDEERRDIARDLHDEFGPHLFAMRASSQALIRALQKSPPNLPQANTLAEQFITAVDAIQSTNRRVLQQLNPIGLDELGLAESLRALATMWTRQNHPAKLSLHLDGDLTTGIDKTVATTVYRVVQEGLTNAFRHADATTITVDVRRQHDARTSGDQMCIAIVDDGTGLPSEHQESFGLKGMRDRVHALGGRLSLSGAANDGTRITAVVPLTPVLA